MKIIIPTELSLEECSISETDDNDGPTWNTTHIYAKDDLCRYLHKTYKSLFDSNQGNRPDQTTSGEDAAWQLIGATAPYRMLDDYVETQTLSEAGKDLTFKVAFKRCDSLCLMNIQGLSAHIKIIDQSDESVTLDEEYNLQDDIKSLSPYEYCFSSISCNDTYINTRYGVTVDGILEVTITPSGSEQAKVGHIILGRRQDIGETKYGAELGITDYSKKSTDEFGVTSLVKRSFSKNASLNLFVPSYRADQVFNILSTVRATPILIEGQNIDTNHSALTIYGWIEDWRLVYEGPNENELRIEFQGLI